MSKQTIPQVEPQVKCECEIEGCREYIFRDGLCLFHYVEEETAAWDDHADEIAQAHAVSVGRG